MNENSTEVLGQQQVVPEEKLLPQTDVNELVRIQKEKAYNKGYQKALEELNSSQGQAGAPVGAPAVPSQADLDKIVAEKTQAELMRLQQEQQAHNTVMQVAQKVEAAKANYPDFDQTFNELKLDNYPHLLSYVNQFHNSGDILYDLAKNPFKLGQVLHATSIDPHLATTQLRELSNSIEANKAAQKLQLPPDPLDQSKPSAIGVDNSRPQSVRDFRKMFRA